MRTRAITALGPITNFVWRGDAGVGSDETWDAPAAIEPDDVASLRGQFALHLRDSAGHHLLARDPLGVNKLFFAVGRGGEVVSSNHLWTLRRRGFALHQVWSVPPAHALTIDPRRAVYRLRRTSELAFAESTTAPIDAIAATIRGALEATFRRLARTLRGRPVYVTMSGGLDSTVIAAMAREHLGAFTGVTFARDDEPESDGSDLRHARLVARELDVPLEIARMSAEALLALVDDVLVRGQDWRDFNVHCGLVNAAIASHLRQVRGAPDDERPVLLTGDGMNELMADYTPVEYRGREHYGLPKLSPGRLRRFLTAGLDAGDREIGIFHAYGFDAIQPYALCAPAYAAVPDALIEIAQAKQQLVRHVMGTRVPAAIYERPKVRAQVANQEQVGGTMALLLDRGIDGDALRARFARLFEASPREVDMLIRGGFYRFSAALPGGEDHVGGEARRSGGRAGAVPARGVPDPGR